MTNSSTLERTHSPIHPYSPGAIPLGWLRVHGYEFDLAVHDGNDGAKHFELSLLGGYVYACDEALGNVLVTAEGQALPDLDPAAADISLLPGSEFETDLHEALIDLSAAIDGARLDPRYDFTAHPMSPFTILRYRLGVLA